MIGFLLNWEAANSEEITRYVLWFKYDQGGWDYKILDGNTSSYSLQYIVGEKKSKIEKLGLTAVDRVGNQSEFKEINLKRS